MAKDKTRENEAPIPTSDQKQGSSSEIKNEKSAFLTSGKFYSIQAIPGIGQAVGSFVEVPESANYDSVAAEVTNGQSNFRIAGVARVRYGLTFGIGDNLSTPLNQAAQSLYNKTQDKMNNRNLPFSGVDELRVVISHDSFYQGYLLGYRALLTLGKADIANDYLPQALFAAYGFDYASFRANKAQLREDLATWRDIITKRYPCPKVFKMLDVHSQMVRFIYGDSNSRKAQFYVCTPSYLWSWETEDTGFKLKAKQVLPSAQLSAETHMMTYAEYVQLMYDMLNAMLDSTDFQRISAALLTTFGESDVVDYPDPLTEAALPFVYDEGFNDALQNATIAYVGSDYDSLAVATAPENVNVLVASVGQHINPELNDAVDSWGLGPSATLMRTPLFINMSKDNPTAEEMTNYMRWKAYMNPTLIPGAAATAAQATYDTVATEVILGIDIVPVRPNAGWYYCLANSTFNARTQQTSILGPLFFNSAEKMQRGFARLAIYDAFDYLPPIMTTLTATDSDTGVDTVTKHWFVHWHFQATVSPAELRAYHKAILWSALLE